MEMLWQEIVNEIWNSTILYQSDLLDIMFECAIRINESIDDDLDYNKLDRDSMTDDHKAEIIERIRAYIK